MNAHQIPNDHRVARYCTPDRVRRGASVNDDVIRYGAFMPRQKDQGRLSSDWLEVFGRSQIVALHCIRCFFGKTFGLKGDGRFVVLGIEEVKEVIRATGNSPAVVSDPTPENPSHALLTGFELEAMQVAIDLATLANEHGWIAPGRTTK